MLVSLQTVFSVFWNDPRIYNLLSYFICAPLLIVWGVITVRRYPTPERAWLALAAIACLSMLPVYHRQLDTKLLLLTVPACAMLWAKRNRVGRLALFTTFAALILVGDLPWVILLALINKFQFPANLLMGRLLMAIQVLPVPLILLSTCMFYLWVYVWWDTPENEESNAVLGTARSLSKTEIP
jgi:hypothetical protein